MGRTPYQKLKLLRIMEILLTETDEDHSLTAEEISDRLGKDLAVGRKSVYSDIASLQDFGLDVQEKRGKKGGFACLSREFELPELMFLADAVSASRFITEKKARALLKKLGTLTSTYHAAHLDRQVVVQNRTSEENEKIYYTVDVLSNAITMDEAVRFRYTGINAKKERFLRHDGAYHVVSPAFLLWANENYYLVAYSHLDKEIRHYRVDRMVDTESTGEKRKGKKERSALDRKDYARRTFGMFQGEKERVRLSFDRALAGVLLDRFGMDIPMHETRDGRAVCIVEVELSDQFYGWISGLGPKIRIESPESVQKSYLEFLKGILSSYPDR